MAFDLESGSSQYLSNADGLAVIDAATISIALTYMVESRSGTDTLYYSGSDATTEANRTVVLLLRDPGGGNDFLTEFFHQWTGDNGGWQTAALSFDTWYHSLFTYDRGLTTNNPILYQNGATLTVGSGLTETSTPSSAAVTGTDSLSLAAFQASALFGDIRVAEMAHWTRILTAGEGLAISNGYSPKFFRPVTYWNLVRDLTDEIGGVVLTNNNSATVTAHPRVINPAKQSIFVPAAAVAGAGIRNPFGGPMVLRNPLGA